MSDFQRMPDEVAARIREMGPVFNAEVLRDTCGLYRPYLSAVHSKNRRRLLKDIAYGGHERQQLDIHLPESEPPDSAATVIYFHGGGFVGGDKNVGGELIFGTVLDYFVRHGMIGVNATYRLAPEAHWPSGARDVAGVVAWVRRNIAGYGGDPERIFLVGHSAGATHVATYALHRELSDVGNPCAGVVLISGLYDPRAFAGSPNIAAYFGEDEALYARNSVLGNVYWSGLPVAIMLAEHEPAAFSRNAAHLFSEMTSGYGRAPCIRLFRGHNHISPVLGIGTGDGVVGPEILDFLNSAAAQRR